jgi:septal ring factor EnvC (AmiA/AmiB activator)
MPADPDRITSVLDPALRRPFALIVGIGAALAFTLFGLAKVEAFVDGRIEMKLASQREKLETQEQRLARMETQIELIRDSLSDIKADLRVIRERMEKEKP